MNTMHLFKIKVREMVSSAQRRASRKMADLNDKNPLNVIGRFYNDLSCIDCGMCPDLAPRLFRRDDEEGFSYVYRQPESEDEVELALQAMEACPTESIGLDDSGA